MSGAALLAAAVTGALLGAKAPHRWGRPGGALLVGGLSILLVRDTTMIASGSLSRLQLLPAGLLLAETATATAGIALGAGAWLAANEPDLGTSTERGSQLATLTCAIHALRQVIYLSPGQGRRETSQ